MTVRRRLLGVIATSLLLGVVLWLPSGQETSEGLAIQIDVREPALAAEFAIVLADVLDDERGWSASGARIALVDDSLYRIGIASSDDMAAACAPYGLSSKFACRPGSVGMINATLWATPPAWWPGDRDAYRRHAVNHELGHLLGLRGHPACPGPGARLPVMALPPRDTTDCVADGWPTGSELEVLHRVLTAAH